METDVGLILYRTFAFENAFWFWLFSCVELQLFWSNWQAIFSLWERATHKNTQKNHLQHILFSKSKTFFHDTNMILNGFYSQFSALVGLNKKLHVITNGFKKLWCSYLPKKTPWMKKEICRLIKYERNRWVNLILMWTTCSIFPFAPLLCG